ncbi:MAG: putative quinol monooxygenase, partial [Pseudomonadota bacterium]
GMAVGVIARLKIIPEKQADFELAFSRFQNTVRSQEKGNVLFALHKSRDVVGDYVVMEEYINDDALVEHRNTEHYKALPERMGEFMAGPPEILVYDSVN